MKTIFQVCISFSLIVLFNGCQTDNQADMTNELMEYDGKYVGDASAIGNILTLLETEYNGLELSTSDRPYGINVICTNHKSIDKQEILKKAYLYKATVIFSLIQNVDEVKFSHNNNLYYIFTRNELDSFFNQTIVNYGNDKDKWENELLNKLNSDDIVSSFYSNYNIIRD